MKKILNYFKPNEESSYFNELRTGFFIKLCLIGIFLIFVVIISDLLMRDGNYVLSIFSKIVAVLFLIVSVFVLKHKGIVFAGNIFSLGIVISLLIFMNMVSIKVDVTYKFVQSFYSIFGYIILSVLFASRPIIIVNFILAFGSTTHVFLYMLKHQSDKSELLTAAYINHSIILVGVAVILFFANRFMDLAIKRATDEIESRELQNKELLTSEEEIRAANEELVATTDALVEANEELLESKEKAEESDRLKTEFLNNMSHEVRTPMNGIIGFSQLLDIPDLSDKARQNYISTIQRSSHQLLSIIDNIIEISKLGTKQVKVVEQQINLNKMLQEMFTVFDNEIKDKSIVLNLNTPLKNIDSNILMDEIKLYKILSNLLENSLKFTESGSIDFGYKVLEDHTLDYDSMALQFYVNDTGIGILPEKQELIFSRFLQADSDLSRQFGGLGLGLSIAKENTELMHGEISLTSERGKGSTFFVTLPYKPCD